MGSKAKGQSAPLSGSQQPVLAVQPERLRELSSNISLLGLEAGILADLLESKIHNTSNGENLSDHLYFAAQVLKRFQQGLADAEGDISTLARTDIDLAEFVRWVKVGPS